MLYNIRHISQNKNYQKFIQNTINNKMKSKSNSSHLCKQPSSSTTQPLHSEYLRSNTPVEQWFEILSDIDALTTKVRQISHKQSKPNKKNPQKYNRQVQKLSKKVSITTTNILQNFQYNTRTKNNKKGNSMYCQSMSKNFFNNITRKNSLKNMNKNNNKSAYSSNRNLVDSRIQPQLNQYKQEYRKDICNPTCHSMTIQINQLRKQNYQLHKKNKELQEKLQKQKRKQKQYNKINRLQQKASKYKQNQFVFKIIKENSPKKIVIQAPFDFQTKFSSIKEHVYNETQGWQPFSIQLKPTQKIRKNASKDKNSQIIQQKYIEKQEKNSQKYPPHSNKDERQQKNLRKSSLKAHILNISKQTRSFTEFQPQQFRNNPNINTHNATSQSKINGSEIKTLQNQFDRLMEISHLQRSRRKKRIIWDQMKSIASKLKLIRSFTQD